MYIEFSLVIPQTLLTKPPRLKAWLLTRLAPSSYPDLVIHANTDGRSTITFARNYPDPQDAAAALQTFFTEDSPLP